MKKHSKILAALILPLALLGCKDDDDTTEIGQNIQATPDELRGTWKSDCVGSDVLNLPATQREYVFNAIGDFDRVERFYSDSGCQNLVATYKVIGTVEAKGHNPESSDPEVNMVNFTVNNAMLTVNSDTIIDALNTMKLCGKADWALNQETEVTNADCEGSRIGKGSVQFDSYDVRDGQLYLGQKFLFLSKDDASARPKELDTSTPFHKQ